VSGPLTVPMLVLIGFCILAETAREVCFKQAANGAASFIQSLIKPAIWAGLVFWAVELLAWMAVLERVPLSIAFPLMALSYVVTVFAAALLLKEAVSFRHAAGASLITAGVMCVGVTGL
jgi:undecaprenyl phosphate-alpha-L-ara4N flippase subunit ArnE